MPTLFKGIYRPLRPTLFMCLWANHRVIKDPDDAQLLQLRNDWIALLTNGPPSRRESVATAYRSSVDRIATLEAKGIGALQAIAIVSAGAFIALTGTAISVALASAALFYLTTAGWACCSILLPRKRWSPGIDDVKAGTDGYPEMAAATEAMKGAGIRTSNLVTSAVYDLIRGLILTLAGLVAFVSIGHLSGSSKPSVRPPSHSVASPSVSTETHPSKPSPSPSHPQPRPTAG